MRFIELAQTYNQIELKTKRLERTEMLSELFKKASTENIDTIIYITQGSIAPPHKNIEVGLGEKFVEQAIAVASGYSVKTVEGEYKKTGDIGEAAENLLGKKTQTSLSQDELTIEKVFGAFMKIAKSKGKGSQDLKKKILIDLLNSAEPLEARYVVRFPLGRLRLGVGDPTMLDALSFCKKGDKSIREELERAYNISNDLGLVARTLFENESKIKEFEMKVFNPVRPALAERLSSAEEIIEKLGKCNVEAKYDGFRCQIHKQGEKVEIFSRKLEPMADMFPEIVEATKRYISAKNAIFEGEAIAFNEQTGEYRSFQLTIQRKRKYGISELMQVYPLRLFAFDVLFDGKDISNEKYSQRREILKSLVNENETIKLSESIVTDDTKELEGYFEKCIERGLEGIIAKDLNSPYIAGARKFAWIKLKRSYKSELADTLDLVILGYYLGKGKRAKFAFGGLLCGVYDDEEGTFRTVAKIGSGFSEEQMQELESTLRQIAMKEKPRNIHSLMEPDIWVEPKYVITVSADEITRSPTHTCGMGKTGYALRFPRMIHGIRSEKGPEDSTTVNEVLDMFQKQKKIILDSSF
ncbi:MAG: ATP-dependent DNA ligase [Candidatus Micrarchaeota archaeon]